MNKQLENQSITTSMTYPGICVTNIGFTYPFGQGG